MPARGLSTFGGWFGGPVQREASSDVLLRLDGDGPVHRLHALTHDRETESHALRAQLVVEVGMDTDELVEDEVELQAGNADAVVGDDESGVRHGGVGDEPGRSARSWRGRCT